MGKFIDFAPRKTNQNTNQTAVKSNKPSNTNTFYMVIIIVLIVVFIYSLNSLFSKTPVVSSSSEPSSEPSVAGSSVASVDNKNLEPNSSSQNNTNTPCTGDNCTPTEKAGLQKENINIEILNGSGRPDAAAQVKEFLTNNGYTVSNIDTANNLYQTTVIYFKKGSDTVANNLANTLTEYETSIQENSELVEGHDIIVVVGQK